MNLKHKLDLIVMGITGAEDPLPDASTTIVRLWKFHRLPALLIPKKCILPEGVLRKILIGVDNLLPHQLQSGNRAPLRIASQYKAFCRIL